MGRHLPDVVYTDPQAASLGATEAAFSATTPVSEVAKTATYTRAYAQSKGFLTLLGERRDGSHMEVLPRVRAALAEQQKHRVHFPEANVADFSVLASRFFCISGLA